MAVRDFPRAAKLLLECVATFVAGELTSYTGLVFYAVTSALVALERVDLKSKVGGGRGSGEDLFFGVGRGYFCARIASP